MKTVSITHRQNQVLELWKKYNNQWGTLHSIACELKVTAGNVSLILAKLVREGVLEKRNSRYHLIPDIDIEIIPLNKRPRKSPHHRNTHRHTASMVIAEPAEPRSTQPIKKSNGLRISSPKKLPPVEYCNGKLTKVPIPKY